ncbi:prenyltransferase [Klenkia sp. PcliD-1-E]|uniref:prenyltransferase n=1 Tax=Klenkia sp. PcliD-1-E TaxID=2954492 RepID=UPI002097899E|nr:prenyltransferase [Klenkia sp. PcliD-1-E]MCO7222440.1 prenyltransferase [Klenkia sp. PcliD-1-E]
MTLLPEVPGVLSGDQVAATVAAVAAEQAADGMLPWWRGGQLDAWDCVEAAMALTVGGLVQEAAAALDWLCARQLPSGGFPSQWREGAVTAPGVEANHAGYLAVGALHHALVTGGAGARWWGPVSRALDLVCRMQLPSGAVGWALRPDGTPDDVALVTGSSSLLQALRCGLVLAGRVGEERPHWAAAADRLQGALVDDPGAFDDRSRFSMDWYYPVLGGALTGAAAEDRLAASWDAFVVPGLGVRCVADRPWVTGAETCELAMALVASGQTDAATEQLAAVQHLRHADGGYWTGYVFADDAVWPVERTTWTAAAVVLAADALSGATPGAALFTDPAFSAVGPR